MVLDDHSRFRTGRRLHPEGPHGDSRRSGGRIESELEQVAGLGEAGRVATGGLMPRILRTHPRLLCTIGQTEMPVGSSKLPASAGAAYAYPQAVTGGNPSG